MRFAAGHINISLSRTFALCDVLSLQRSLIG